MKVVSLIPFVALALVAITLQAEQAQAMPLPGGNKESMEKAPKKSGIARFFSNNKAGKGSKSSQNSQPYQGYANEFPAYDAYTAGSSSSGSRYGKGVVNSQRPNYHEFATKPAEGHAADAFTKMRLKGMKPTSDTQGLGTANLSFYAQKD
ncbi:hypothetical protein CBS101457_003091 [Exobasidium rhododendri]|nr:hypothetical protein CBS101457_003091 [Exobasidium rhododendri]